MCNGTAFNTCVSFWLTSLDFISSDIRSCSLLENGFGDPSFIHQSSVGHMQLVAVAAEDGPGDLDNAAILHKRGLLADKYSGLR